MYLTRHAFALQTVAAITTGVAIGAVAVTTTGAAATTTVAKRRKLSRWRQVWAKCAVLREKYTMEVL
jgi:hypothetical protein